MIQSKNTDSLALGTPEAEIAEEATQTAEALVADQEVTSALHNIHLQQKLTTNPLAITELPYQERKHAYPLLDTNTLDADAKEKLAQWVEFQNLTSADITPEISKEAARFAMEIFSTTWPECAFCPECDQNPENPNGKRVSAQEIFDLEPKQLATVEQINDRSKLPICDTEGCGQQMVPFFDKETTENIFAKKLALQHAYLTLMRGADGQVKGINLAYKDTLEKVFGGEWKNPYMCSGIETRPEVLRDFENFRKKVSDKIATNDPEYGLKEGELIDPSDEFVGANCIAVHPEYQGSRHFTNLSTQTFFMIPYEAYEGLYGACESRPNTRAHGKFLEGGGLVIEGIMSPEGTEINEDEYVIMLYNPVKLFMAYCNS